MLNKEETSNIDDYQAEDITAMGLLVKTEDITTETVLLRNLHNSFKTDNANDASMKEVEWGKDNVAAVDGFKCNTTIVLCEVKASVPGRNGDEEQAIAGKLYFPKKTLGGWIKDYLTTAHIKYKATDKIVTSEPSQ